MNKLSYFAMAASMGLLVVGLSSIAWGSIATFGALFGAGALLLIFTGIFNMRTTV